MKLRSIVVVGTVLALAAPAVAQEEESLATRYTSGKRVKQRGALGKLRGQKVSIAGRRTLTAGEIADGVFGEQQELTKELAGARGALLDDPEVTEELVETDEATVITTSTKITVVDPDALRRKSKRFGAMRKKRGRDGYALARLTAAERKEFDAFKARMQRLPPKHPLRKAADQGDDALLDAVIDGQGDVTVTTTVVVPKTGIKRTANGKLLVRKVDADGNVDFSSPVEIDSRIGMRAGGIERRIVPEEEPSPPKTKTKGKTGYTAKFLTGFTEADDFIWEKRWDFSFGFVSVKFHPWYEFGLRVPIEVKASMTPATVVHTGPEDVAAEFEVELGANTLDADASFYKEVGLDGPDVGDGKEFLLGAGFEVVVRVKAGWVVDKKWVIPENAKFDWGADFVPPFGDCTNCGKDFWIDAKYTRTELNLLKIVEGSARVGFKLAGDGKIEVDYEALSGDGTVKSWPGGKKADATHKHTLGFGDRNDLRRMKAEAEQHDRAGVTKHFGYRLSNPKYEWKVVVTPGVRGDIDITAKPLLNEHFTIGPLWLDVFAITLGTLELEQHKGTKGSYKLKHGDKTWQKK